MMFKDRATGGLTAREKRAIKKFERGSGFTSTYLPGGRSFGFYIYAVTVKDHPDKVKIGQTNKWKSRCKEYENWNLADGDGILEAAVFCLTEEYVSLKALEAHILETTQLERAARREWFFGDVEEAARHIDRVLTENEITYVL
jgi:hypothetical protein